MKDFMGNKINVGDRVVVLMHNRTSSEFRYAVITNIHNVMVTVLLDNGRQVKKQWDKIISVDTGL